MKKRFLALMMAALMLTGIWGCGKKEKEKEILLADEELVLDDFWEESEGAAEVTESEQQLLLDDYASGAIGADDVVSQSIEAIFNGGDDGSDYDLDTFDIFAQQHWEELDQSTKEEYYKNMFFSGIDFEYEGEGDTLQGEAKGDTYGLLHSGNNLSDALDAGRDNTALSGKNGNEIIEYTGTNSDITRKLTQVMLSDDGKFLVWYTTSGDNAVTKSYAKEVGKELDKAVAAYDKLFSQNYSFDKDRTVTGTVYNKQKKMLKAAGLDENLLDNVMSVYIMDFANQNVLAYYKHTEKESPLWLDLLGSLYGAVPDGIAVLPFMVIRPGTSFGTGQKQVVNHELFHHYQSQLFSTYTRNQPVYNLGLESTANWASAMITENNNYTSGMLNDWSSLYTCYSYNLMSDYVPAMIEKYKEDENDKNRENEGITASGYAFFPFVYNYSQEVTKGTEKVVAAYYSNDFMSSLENQATSAQRETVMRKLLLYNLNNNYTNKNLTNNYLYKLPYVSISQKADGSYPSIERDIPQIGIGYFIYKKNGGQDVDFIVNNADEGANAVLLAKKDGKYQIIQSYQRSVGKLSTAGFEGVDQFYLVIYNTSFTERNSISISIEAHAGAEVTEKITLALTTKVPELTTAAPAEVTTKAPAETTKVQTEVTTAKAVDTVNPSEEISTGSPRLLISNSSGLFALFAEDGTQITDFKFKNLYKNAIYNGVFAARDNTSKNNNMHLYDENGKMMIPVNQSVDGFDYAKNLYVLDDYYSEKLIDSGLNVLMDNVDDYLIYDYIEIDGFVTVYDRKAKNLWIVTKNGEISDKINTENYAVYNGYSIWTVVCDSVTVVLATEKAVIADVIDGKWLTSNYSGFESDMSQGMIMSDDAFRYYKDGKLVKEYSKKEYYDVRISAQYGNPKLIVYTDKDNAYFYGDTDKKFVNLDVYKNTSTYSQLDYNTYVIVTNGTARFYVNGKNVSVENSVKSTSVGNYTAQQYIIQKSDGYHLFDKNGNEISKKGYYVLTRTQKNFNTAYYYIQETSDSAYKLTDANMKVLFENFTEDRMFEIDGVFYHNFKIGDSYKVYGPGFSEIMSSSVSPTCYKEYIHDTATNTYYNYQGKVIYSEK